MHHTYFDPPGYNPISEFRILKFQHTPRTAPAWYSHNKAIEYKMMTKSTRITVLLSRYCPAPKGNSLRPQSSHLSALTTCQTCSLIDELRTLERFRQHVCILMHNSHFSVVYSFLSPKIPDCHMSGSLRPWPASWYQCHGWHVVLVHYNRGHPITLHHEEVTDV